jgi:hypothetical protein
MWSSLTVPQGMLVGWGVLSPVSKMSGWAPGPVGDMTSGARGWILWVSLAIMCADSLVSLLPVATEYFTHLLPARIYYAMYGHEGADEDKEDHECETEDRLVPIRWVLGGLGGSVIIGTMLVWVVFGNEGIKPWATLIGFVLGGLLSILG